MSLFTTRVELHMSSAEDYKKLHEEMESEGFSRTIQLSGETKIYQLPTAEYNYSHKTKTAEDVMKMAISAATRAKLQFSILVTKADGRRYWHNLKEV